MRFQQLSGSAMAKGVEDTAFYRFTRLVALNEVGGDPGRFGLPVAEFHAANARIQDRWPGTMTALSTHDTKRSADVRARLALLSEVPERWASFASGWMDASARHWAGAQAGADRPTQWLLLQTLVGAWPIDVERAVAYMAKATKEAKLRTTWTEPDEAYDTARDAYVEAVLNDADLVAEVEGFVAGLAPAGYVNGVAQQLLALTLPGVPDIYQGNELVDLSLVDPDNRRPVDFARRRALLAGLDDLSPEDLLARAAEGLPKLRVTRDALHLRRRRPGCFGAGDEGAYRPLPASGAEADHVVAFTRGAGADVVVVVPRLVLGLPAPRPEEAPGVVNPVTGRWTDTTVAVPPGTWSDLVTGASWTVSAGTAAILVGDLLARFPVALLERTG
jgi:(1->4)-alpha-D-glucan 1-alpha-D-glucosylmutase